MNRARGWGQNGCRTGGCRPVPAALRLAFTSSDMRLTVEHFLLRPGPSR